MTGNIDRIIPYRKGGPAGFPPMRLLTGCAAFALAVVFCGCGGGSPPNEPPSLTLTASSTYIKAQEIVTFYITASDPEGGHIRLSIDLGDGNSEDNAPATVDHNYASEGEYVVSVEAVDDGGAAAQASLQVTVTPAGGSPNIRLNAVTLHIQTTEGPLDQVDVNGDFFPVDAAGNADAQVPLETGITRVSIRGQDAAGNEGAEQLEFEVQ